MLPVALAYAGAGFAALVAGYGAAGWFLRDAHRPALGLWPDRPPIGKIVTLIVVGSLATAEIVARGRVVGGVFSMAKVSAETFTVLALSQFVQLAAAICAIYLVGTRRPFDRGVLALLFLGVLLPISALQAFLFGSKSRVLLTLFFALGAYNYSGRRRLRLTTAILSVVVMLVVVFPAVNLYRAGAFRIGATRSVGAFLTSLKALGEDLISGGFVKDGQLALESVVARSHGIDSLSLVIKYRAQRDLAHARDYLLIPAYAFVPRLVWPSKPTAAAAVRFKRAFMAPLESTADLEDSPAFGIFHIGDLFATFGPGGMLAGLFVLGGLYRSLYWRYDPQDSGSRRGIFMFLALLWLVINGFESDVPTVYANILKMLVILWIVSVFIAGRTRERVLA
jgi:hypothetical protein